MMGEALSGHTRCESRHDLHTGLGLRDRRDRRQDGARREGLDHQREQPRRKRPGRWYGLARLTWQARQAWPVRRWYGRDVDGVIHRARRRVRIDSEHEMDARALARFEERDHEAAPAAVATHLAVGAYEGHPARDLIAHLEVPGGQMAAIADGDPVAREPAGAHRLGVGLLLDR